MIMFNISVTNNTITLQRYKFNLSVTINTIKQQRYIYIYICTNAEEYIIPHRVWFFRVWFLEC